MKTLQCEKYQCEYCKSKYYIIEECEKCESSCKIKSECNHVWNYKISDNSNPTQLFTTRLYVSRMCRNCTQVDDIILTDFEFFFKDKDK